MGTNTNTTNNKDDEESNKTKTPMKPSLPKLLAALAAGARSVNSLPLSNNPNNNNSDDNDDNDDNDDEEENKQQVNDEYSFHMAFPEVQSLCSSTKDKLAHIVSLALDISCPDLSVSGTLTASRTTNNDNNSNSNNNSNNNEENKVDFDDPLLWENAAEACEVLLEQVEVYIQNVKEGKLNASNSTMADMEQLTSFVTVAGRQVNSRFHQVVEGTMDIEKPQVTYNFHRTIQNSRTEPFQPILHHPKPFGIEPYPTQPCDGHGLDTKSPFVSYSKFKDGSTNNNNNTTTSSTNNNEKVLSFPKDMVAPTHHYPHMYQREIQELEYHSTQFQISYNDDITTTTSTHTQNKKWGKHGKGGTLSNPNIATHEGIWIDTEQQLQELIQRIYTNGGQDENNVTTNREIAIDLEAHSYRSFSGFTCVMQLSLRRPTLSTDGSTPLPNSTLTNETSIETAYDFLIDTLALRSVLNQYLAPIFANPNICKVMHGADSDIPWLQRDFGIYVVNLFDTGRAARALPSISSAGLAHLLMKYGNVSTDKKYQLSDWRQRPLSQEMKVYATTDTMYLLDIYDALRFELNDYQRNISDGSNDDEISIKSVLDVSKKVCLIRYDKEPFYPSGYTTMMKSKRAKSNTNNNNNKSSSLSPTQETLLKQLYDWRDDIARTQDESPHYVCPNLYRIAQHCPTSVLALKGLFHPVPPLVMAHVNNILAIVRDVTTTATTAAAAAASMEGRSATASHQERIAPPPTPSTATKTTINEGSSRQLSGMLSPVLGTEALYKQAGWMTPLNHITTEEDDDDGDEEECDNDEDENTTASEDKDGVDAAVMTHEANQDYVASEYSVHSLEMKSMTDTTTTGSGAGGGGSGRMNKSSMDGGVSTNRNRRGKTVDGLGAARMAMKRGGSGGDGGTMAPEEEINLAKKRTNHIRGELLSGKQNLLGLTKSSCVFLEEGVGKGCKIEDLYEDEEMEEEMKKEKEEKEQGFDNEIPKSMEEIYKISNRNRRRSKKNQITFDTNITESTKAEELKAAEEYLARNGPGGMSYFGDDATARQQKTKKQRSGSIVDDAVVSNESSLKGSKGSSNTTSTMDNNINFMTELGWVKDKEEVQSLMSEQNSKGAVGDEKELGNTTSTTSTIKDSYGKNQQVKQKRSSSNITNRQLDSDQVMSNNVFPIYDPKGATSDNPFFAGAAISGGILNQKAGMNTTSGKQEKKKTGGQRKGKRTNGADRNVRRGSHQNKTTVYRGQR